MSKTTLTYFNARGAAEGIRYMLAAAGVDYEDKRVTQEEWPALKPDQPFGQLPVLTVTSNGDTQQIPQVRAIYRYLARTYGLYGNGICEQTQIDVALEVCEEFTFPMITYWIEKDPDTKAKKKTELIEECVPKVFPKVLKMLEANNGGAGWVIGEKISIADICFMATCEMLIRQSSEETIFGKFPKLQKYYERIRAQKGIAAWIKKRPETEN
ncbi:hematopoietic prostaglandin D synthase-like [Antedon mediterranea]|uniref:hematopoietic prostaglandin D synthase-like n=1 Tax=Antedon mediterranea TaxID=105859 RepID=UPI003AF9F70E